MVFLRTAFLALAMMLAFAVSAYAGTYEDGFAAAKRGDYATAVRLWRPLAEQGDARAQFNLGLSYANGWGVPLDYAQAVKWYRKAADQGLAWAQTNLGIMYENGQGVRQDFRLALIWYRKAAKQGDAEARRMAREWMAKHQR